MNDLPGGWHWKSDESWTSVVRCASNGDVDVFLDVDGDLSIYGSDTAPASVIVAVLNVRISIDGVKS